MNVKWYISWSTGSGELIVASPFSNDFEAMLTYNYMSYSGFAFFKGIKLYAETGSDLAPNTPPIAPESSELHEWG